MTRFVSSLSLWRVNDKRKRFAVTYRARSSCLGRIFRCKTPFRRLKASGIGSDVVSNSLRPWFSWSLSIYLNNSLWISGGQWLMPSKMIHNRENLATTQSRPWRMAARSSAAGKWAFVAINGVWTSDRLCASCWNKHKMR